MHYSIYIYLKCFDEVRNIKILHVERNVLGCEIHRAGKVHVDSGYPIQMRKHF